MCSVFIKSSQTSKSQQSASNIEQAVQEHKRYQAGVRTGGNDRDPERTGKGQGRQQTENQIQ